MSNYGQGIMAYDNKRKVMRSTIFENDDTDSSIPVSIQPKYEQTQNFYNNPDSSDNRKSSNNQYSSSTTSQTSMYKKPNFYKTATVNDKPIHMPQIEPVEIPPPLPTLTPFPEFRFDAVSPIGQIDLGIRPRDPSDAPKQDNKNNLNAIVFQIGGALQKIRDDLMQESMTCTQKMKNISTNNENLQLNVDFFNIPRHENNEQQQQQQFNEFEPPQITTSSQFMFPDGTTIENP